MKKLPAPNEFTPGQLGSAQAVFVILNEIEDRKGDRKEISEWIRTKWFADSASKRKDPLKQREQQCKRANNVLTGMQQYGVVQLGRTTIGLTELGRSMVSNVKQPQSALEEFASYLLREKYGMELLQVASDIKARDGVVSKSRVDEELRSRGFQVSTNSSYTGKLRQWLEPSGVVDKAWNVNSRILAQLSGASPEDVRLWRGLSPQQRSTVEALRHRYLGNRKPIQSSDLLELLRQRGIEFNAKFVGKEIYQPLESSGLISRNLKTGGRGGKGGAIELTQKGLEIDGALIDGLELGDVPADLQSDLNRSTESIIADLGSDDTSLKGLALELLSLRMASDIGLVPADMRLRSSQTGGAEVDLVAEGAHLHFSRWLFQCKNQSASVGLSVLAKEIGMASLLKAQVVVIVTTGAFAKSVRTYAIEAAESTSIQVILLDKSSLEIYRNKGPSGLRDELHKHALWTLQRKRHQLDRVPTE